MGLLGHNPIMNRGASVHCRVSVEEYQVGPSVMPKWKMLNVGGKKVLTCLNIYTSHHF